MTYSTVSCSEQLLYGSGNVVVVSGWTPIQTIARRLSSTDYTALGQLYSPQLGISLFLRNLFNNPHVRHLVVIDATDFDKNAGGCRCLLDFFNKGYKQGTDVAGRQVWKINSSVEGCIDFEIPDWALELLLVSVKVHYFETVEEAIAKVKQISALPNAEPWSKPLQFPKAEPTSSILPGELFGHRIEGKTIAETWVKILHRIRSTGIVRPTQHHVDWQELIDVMAVITDEPEEFYVPEYLPSDRAFVENYLGNITSDAGAENVEYTYGQRLRSWFGVDQVERAIQQLKTNPNSARVVMSLWDVQGDGVKNNPPCLNHIWLRIVEGRLCLTATFRSNDMYGAWCANAFGLKALSRAIAQSVGVDDGVLIIVSQSAHIYGDRWDVADAIVKHYYADICRVKDYYDPCGDYVISVEGGEVVVERTFPKGAIVKTYRGKNALRLVDAIVADAPAIQPRHIGYLGVEIAKAIACLKSGDRYVQDR